MNEHKWDKEFPPDCSNQNVNPKSVQLDLPMAFFSLELLKKVEFQPPHPSPEPCALSFSTYFRYSSTVVAPEVKMPPTPMKGAIQGTPQIL